MNYQKQTKEMHKYGFLFSLSLLYLMNTNKKVYNEINETVISHFVIIIIINVMLIIINAIDLAFYYSKFELIRHAVFRSIAQLHLIKDPDVFEIIFKHNNKDFFSKINSI